MPLSLERGAHERTRTADPDLTKIVLCLLSYVGLVVGAGFEPANPFREPDLQSGAINRSAIPPTVAVDTQTWNRRRVTISRPALQILTQAARRHRTPR